MKKILLLLFIFFSCKLLANQPQDWTKVSCPNKNHEDIYEYLMFFVKYTNADIGYNDGHQFNAYFTIPTETCYEAMHILNVIIYDGSFLYNLEQSIQFEADFESCAEEVRQQVVDIEKILQHIDKI